MKTSTLFTNYIHSSFGRFLLCVPTVIGCFAISPMARAVVPPPDGGYPNNNTAEGDSALFNLTNGLDNTAIGFQALFLNTEGDFNTASGADALAGNHGSFNTANGYQALLFNTGGGYNTATGTAALRSNVSGFQNLANGVNALYSNATGYRNTANGYQALYFNTTGNRNTAEGFQALFHNIGSDNVGLGFNAGSNLTIGSGNVCIGNGVLGGCWRKQHHPDQKRLFLGRVWPSSLRQFRQQNGHARLLAPVQGPDPAHGQGQRIHPSA
ncbi:MAG: hypothetical protein ACJ8KF_15980 [Chthoniobacterales bacterium]